jgi:hypothetical protein
LIGSGKLIIIIVFLSAILGTLFYSWLRPKLPH